MKKLTKLLIGFLIGAILIFFIPIFPVSLPNMEGTLTSLAWFNGLFFLQNNAFKSFALIQSFGAVAGFFITFVIVEVFD